MIRAGKSVIRHYDIRLGCDRDAWRIALMSKHLIEAGLGWSWTEQRVLASIRDRATNVAVARDGGALAGFCIAKFRDEEGHIVLLAVNESQRRRGLGTALVQWMEKTALVAGIGIMYLEARLNNAGARRFYEALGYKEFKLEPRRYGGIETGVCLGKDLWL